MYCVKKKKGCRVPKPQLAIESWSLVIACTPTARIYFGGMCSSSACNQWPTSSNGPPTPSLANSLFAFSAAPSLIFCSLILSSLPSWLLPSQCCSRDPLLAAILFYFRGYCAHLVLLYRVWQPLLELKTLSPLLRQVPCRARHTRILYKSVEVGFYCNKYAV